MSTIGSSLSGASLRLGVGLVLLGCSYALLSGEGGAALMWWALVGIPVGCAGLGFFERGAATLVDAVWFRVRGHRRASTVSGTHRLEIRDVSLMRRDEASRVLRAVGQTPEEAAATVDAGTRHFSSEPLGRRAAERAARAARRYGTEARAEPVDQDRLAER